MLHHMWIRMHQLNTTVTMCDHYMFMWFKLIFCKTLHIHQLHA